MLSNLCYEILFYIFVQLVYFCTFTFWGFSGVWEVSATWKTNMAIKKPQIVGSHCIKKGLFSSIFSRRKKDLFPGQVFGKVCKWISGDRIVVFLDVLTSLLVAGGLDTKQVWEKRLSLPKSTNKTSAIVRTSNFQRPFAFYTEERKKGSLGLNHGWHNAVFDSRHFSERALLNHYYFIVAEEDCDLIHNWINIERGNNTSFFVAVSQKKKFQRVFCGFLFLRHFQMSVYSSIL